MVWIHGNNPVGIDKNVGRVWCELLYAINERQVFCGLPAFGWQTIGPFPAVTALDGFDILTLEHTLIAEARSEIESMSGLGYFYPAFPSTTPYTFATLYAAAMGAGSGWQIPATTGQDFTQTIVIEEIFKCTEKMIRTGTLHTVNTLTWSGSIASGTYATTNSGWVAARAAAYGVTTPVDAAPVLVLAQYDVGTDKYTDYWIMDGLCHFDLTGLGDGIIDGATFLPRIIQYLAWTTKNSDLRIYASTAGEFATPTRDPAGALLVTYNMTAAEYASISWIGTGLTIGVHNYLRLDVGEAGNPLDLDPNDNTATWRVQLATPTYPADTTRLRVYRTKTTWTYG